MKAWSYSDNRIAIAGPLVLGLILLVAALLLLPNSSIVADAIRRATGGTPAVQAPQAPPVQIPQAEILADMVKRFAAGLPLTVVEMQQLLAGSAPKADAAMLNAVADKLAEVGSPASTMGTTYEIMAGGRPAVARAFIEARPDKHRAEFWRLRFAVARAAGDMAGAQALLLSAVNAPGSAPAKDIVEASFEQGMPEMMIPAAERGSIPRLDRARSLDLARYAAGTGRYDLISRIDRAGSADWRLDDPWLAMTLARKAGDTQAALRYAAMLPEGQAGAKDAILLASGDREAIRAYLLENARTGVGSRPVIAQQLLEAGHRGDAMALLMDEAAQRSPEDPIAARLLYLMGPRPDPAGLIWLGKRAAADTKWLPVYLEREQPRKALAFLEANDPGQGTDQLLQRLKLAAAARDRESAARSLDRLLDGRALTPAQLATASAQMQPGMAGRYILALARARVAAGAPLPSDRRDLAWDAWKRNDMREASGQLQAHLRSEPGDLDALRLMANVAARQQGKSAERPWLERALAQTPRVSRDRIDLLERLNRKSEALAVIEELRAQSPTDKNLAIIQSRLLIATGNPGRAQQVVQP